MASTTATSTMTYSPAHIAARSLLSTAPPSTLPTFSFTPFLTKSGHALITTRPVCPAFLAGHCPLGRKCPDRHPTPSSGQQSSGWHPRKTNDSYVCKHWLKGLCKKGDDCDYLHEYNQRKMSECQFFNQNGYCQNGDECLYLHVKEESRLPLCEDYEKGFCEKGPRCGKRHVRRRLCDFYLAGFCPEGKECTRGVHLRSEVELGAGTPKQEDRDDRGIDGDRRMEDTDREDRKGGSDVRGARGGRFSGRGSRWRNKRG